MQKLCARRTAEELDRRLTARTVVVVTILLLVASWIYPPWIIGSGRSVSHGWFFVFDTTSETVQRVDFGRLFLIDGIILAAGGLLAWAAFHNSKALRKIEFKILDISSCGLLFRVTIHDLYNCARAYLRAQT